MRTKNSQSEQYEYELKIQKEHKQISTICSDFNLEHIFLPWYKRESRLAQYREKIVGSVKENISII